MGQKSVKLPWQGELMHRLLAANDDPNLYEHLYPIFFRHLGREMTADDIARMVGCAIQEYAGGMPRGVQDRLYELAPRFIDALVRDRGVADEAKRIMEETLVQQVA